jgi:acetyl-CoA acetyltransferase family protein
MNRSSLTDIVKSAMFYNFGLSHTSTREVFMEEVVIVSAKRSPMGRAHKGQFAWTRIDDICADVLRGSLSELDGLDLKDIEDLILGCAMPEGEQGMNLARQVSFLAGLPLSVAAVTVNRFCSSSLTTAMQAAQAIMTGNGDVMISAGAESMTHVPMGGFNPSLNPKLMKEGMPQAYVSMGITAENLVKKYSISRTEQDEFALASHEKAISAQKDGLFKDEIVPVNAVQKDGSTVMADTDEGPRAGSDPEKLAKLKAAFKKDGSVTAANSSPLTDGAAVTVLMSASKAKALGLKPLAKVVSMAVSGCDPEYMGLGPVESVRKALKRASLTLDDMGLIELNEAFAAQSLAVIKELGIDQKKLNVKGGAIALGHPLGATGARILATLTHGLHQFDKKYGLETMCVGGGQGAAMIIEKI